MPSFSPDALVAAQWQDLLVYENKDADLTITLIDPTTITVQNPQGSPYNLTGLSVNLIVKANRDVADITGITYSCTIPSPATNGIATVKIPAANSNVSGVYWYRVDVVGSETKAVKFGRLQVYAV